jgi:glycosyltransferase involved in cell wall biosynthesis
MNKEPLFSIITVVFNAKKALQDTVESTQRQTFDDYEHIIIDGKSTDGTLEYLQSLTYKNLSFISEKDNGIYDAMNKGMKYAKGKYLLFLNAADTFASDDVLSYFSKAIDRYHPKIIYGNANIYTEDGEFIKILKALDLNKKNLNRYATRVVCHQSIFVQRSISPNYSHSFRLKGELDWYYSLLDLVSSEEVLNQDIVVCNYYLGGTGDKNFLENYLERIKVTKEHNTLWIFVVSMVFFLIPLIYRLKRSILGK